MLCLKFNHSPARPLNLQLKVGSEEQWRCPTPWSVGEISPALIPSCVMGLRITVQIWQSYYQETNLKSIQDPQSLLFYGCMYDTQKFPRLFPVKVVAVSISLKIPADAMILKGRKGIRDLEGSPLKVLGNEELGMNCRFSERYFQVQVLNMHTKESKKCHFKWKFTERKWHLKQKKK